MYNHCRMHYPHQDYYCEENTWQILYRSRQTAIYALIITNRKRQVLLCNQLLGGEFRSAVIWDYHVVPLLDTGGGVHADLTVIDHNAVGGPELALLNWYTTCFPYLNHGLIREGLDTEEIGQYRPVFKVVGAADYLNLFSSDRSHMRKSGAWIQPPPPWNPIYSGVNRLTELIDIDDSFWSSSGFDAEAFSQWLSKPIGCRY